LLRLVFGIRPGIVDITYSIDRLGLHGAFETLFDHVSGEPSPRLSIRARETAFTLPAPRNDAELYRLQVRLLSPLP
jgi:hypothetical protein